MADDTLIAIKPNFATESWCDAEKYQRMYHQSVTHPDEFWAEQARRIDWIKPFTKVKEVSFDKPVKISWFTDGVLNVSYNCLDRHLEKNAARTAVIWESDDPTIEARKLTYQELYDDVCRLANSLKKMGVEKGHRVTIYLPHIPEAIVSILACSRIGAVHSVVFGGFSAEALAGRIIDCNSKIIITADEGRRAGKAIHLKARIDEAIGKCPFVEKVIVVKNTGADISMTAGRDVFYDEVTANEASLCPPAEMNAEDPLFILYTSGSTGQPKGIMHTTGGYLVYTAMTFKYVFDYKPDDVFWCTADVGWITGHSYVSYGPLANCATILIHEGVPNYPNPGRHWELVDKHGVSIYYTAPTAIRSLMKEGVTWPEKWSRKSLRLLGSVGEPINPEAWLWYYRHVGDERCPIVDTWWQTETGGILISPLPGATALKPGSATKPFFGVVPQLLDGEGKLISGAGSGNLCLSESWPGQARTIYGDHDRFEDTYFNHFPGKYFTGDGCRRDEDGYFWITGRVDDVLNVSGHRIGTAELESALVAHHAVSEAAVVGFPHDVKGQGIYAFVTLKNGVGGNEDLKNELKKWIRHEISAMCVPDFIQWAPGLPKTRSGKIMRRILRKIACNEFENLGDISTLADPHVVEDLIARREN